MLQRVVIKISGEMLGDDKTKFNDEVINNIAVQIKKLVDKDKQVSLVIGGGNFWRGREANSSMDLVVADQIGMLATIMNALYVSQSFIQHKIRTVVITPFELNSFTEKYSKNNVVDYISNKTVVIFAGGLGHPYFSTDTIVALRALELNADLVLFAKNIDGVYDSDPKQNKNSKKYRTLNYKTIFKNELNVADISALHLIYKGNIDCNVFSVDKKDSILIACENDNRLFEIGGTKISNSLQEEYYE